jgi:exonuclease SbcD
MALGHIHGHSMLSDRVRYSGAPLHYSFGENPNRGSWLVDLDADGLAAVEWVPLPVPRALATLRAPLEALLTDPAYAPFADAWIRAEYTDTAQQVDVMRRLQTRFPFCAEVRHVPDVRTDADTRTFSGRVRAARDDVELVDGFLAHVRNGLGATEAERALIRDVIGEKVAAEASA